VRYVFLLAIGLVAAGCSTPLAASKPTPTPEPTATPLSLSAVRFHSAPPMTISQNHRYYAVVRTTDGAFTIQLLPKVAPIAVNSFVFLARHHYFDNVIFHRIVPNYIIQTGDPTGTGFGGPGYQFKDEPVTTAYTAGVVAMAHTSQPNSNGSQFFIVTAPQIGLPRNYTIFGRVTQGMKVVEKIGNTPVGIDPATGEQSHPLVTVKMTTVRIRETT